VGCVNVRVATSARVRRLAPPRTLPWSLGAKHLVPLLPLAAALALWAGSLVDVDLDAMTDVGLVSVLPRAYFLALAMLTLGFFAALLGRQAGERVPAVYAATLVLVLHATPAILYGTLRYPWAWKHVGIVDYVQRHGAVDPKIDFLTAYHDWPGFFSLGALATDAIGARNALGLATWAPPFFELLFLGVVVLLARTLSRDRRVVWMTAWLFVVGNWVGQDYFAPQALSYFLYLLILAIALRWFAGRAHTVSIPTPVQPGSLVSVIRGLRRPRRSGGHRRRAQPKTLVGLAAFIVLAAAAIVSSHQLTPLILLLAIGALAFSRQAVLPGLPLLLAVMTVAWITLMARPFLEGNLYWIVDSIGSPSGNANETLLNLDEASSGLVLVSTVDRVLTAAVIALAALGAARRIRRGRLDLSALTLALVPAAMLFATSYGGEILFRIYYFALPFLALLGAHAFFPSRRASGGAEAAVLAASACALLLAGSCVAYFGKERFHRFTHDEVHASRWLHQAAPAGALLVSGTFDYPWAWKNYERYEYLALETESASLRRRAAGSPVPTLKALMRDERQAAAFVVLTRSQEAKVDMTGIMRRGTLQRMERALERDPTSVPVYRGPDASIFRLDPGSPR
jgi:hypothetical protein